MSGNRYILLPRQGLRAASGPASETLRNLPFAVSTRAPIDAKVGAAGTAVKLLDTIAEDGPKLVEMKPEDAAALNESAAPVRLMRIVEYSLPNPTPQPLAGIHAAAGLLSIVVTVRDADSGDPIAGASIVAFTNFASRQGDQGTTDAFGTTTLQLASATIDRLYCYPPTGYWGGFKRSFTVVGSLVDLDLTPVDLSYVDCVREYYPATHFDPATDVRVGVIDTGVGPHTDLNVVKGRNTVTGEPGADYLDTDIHGTHVAGLIGSDQVPPSGLRGMAPGVSLYAYRVFGQGQDTTTNYAILKAMMLAAEDGCDIINLSLGGGPYDEIVQEAVADAQHQGMLVVVAAGNGGRRPVEYPGAYRGAIAVSAMGKEGTFPAGSLEEAELLRPPHAADANEFLAEFSNIGAEISAVGLGVGTLSTLPGDEFGPLSGTSMAAPVVAGAAACLLSNDPVIFGMDRTQARADALRKQLLANCVKRGFGTTFEGFGLPDPLVV